MHTNEPREDPLIDMGYETRDVDFPKLRTAVFYYFGFAIFCGLMGFTIYMNRFVVFGIKPPKEGAAMNRPLPQDPYPRLQGNITSKTDIADMRAEETRRLNATEYADDTHTVVHIPVDKAMQLLVERGLPKTSTAIPGAPGASVPSAATAPAGAVNARVLNSAGYVSPPPTGAAGAGATTPAPTTTSTTPAAAPPKGGQ